MVAVVAREDDSETMLNHALLHARRRGGHLIKLGKGDWGGFATRECLPSKATLSNGQHQPYSAL